MQLMVKLFFGIRKRRRWRCEHEVNLANATMSTLQQDLEQDQTSAIKLFRDCFDQTIAQRIFNYRYAYFDLIPSALLETDFKVQFKTESIKWDDTFVFKKEGLENESQYFFENGCELKGKISFHTKIVYPSIDFCKKVVVQFRSTDLTVRELMYELKLEEQKIIDPYMDLLNSQKAHLNLATIDKLQFNNQSPFGYYCDVIRKSRVTPQLNSSVGDYYFYQEIFVAHQEIKEAIATANLYKKYLSPILHNKDIYEGRTFYYPWLNYYDKMYMLACSLGFERLYTFWDRIVFMVYNFYQGGIPEMNLSFDNYLKKIENQINAKTSTLLFNPASQNVKWLMDFRKNQYLEITEKRHRIIHFKITSDWQGLPWSKTITNVYQNNLNPQELLKLQVEIYQLQDILMKHFSLCIEGFEKSLALIDELP